MLEKEGGCELVDHRCVAWRIIAWERGRRWDRGRLARYESCARKGFAPAERCGGTPRFRSVRTTVWQSDSPKDRFPLVTDC